MMAEGNTGGCEKAGSITMSYQPTATHQLLALAHEDFAYCIAVWPQFELAQHREQIVSCLEAIERGSVSRQIICMPPRHGKSLITSVLFLAWYLGRHPEHHVIFATYGQELSDDFGRQVNLQAIAETDESFRKQGEALWPARYPLSVLERIEPQSEVGTGLHFISSDHREQRAQSSSVTTGNFSRRPSMFNFHMWSNLGILLLKRALKTTSAFVPLGESRIAVTICCTSGGDG